mmetsp:Transcript_11452/g.26948  ORF Transcript_11452/g.26948 Transcript_11452/m.26948 type:complete len:216 (+) Transcript_11452:38-685(+)|eukprot:CAMPEP_0172644674 /NCGR_PEP_ID=MMETSP1068-20121228/239331_1 /TAXON_ID=35684 /ORGANISM="Pseudopedinella elastica, Strain CCMP716" /LENGTH=215 /DNA_ID=CAMNT_0013458881 /DNA_START=22 /DNA_END=669 /DNA_ORIENTATION=+
MALARVTHTIGRALRETGQAINVLGFRAADDMSFKDHFSRHRTVMSLFDESPSVAPGTFVAPCASVVGSVDIADKSSVWYGSVIRGDGSAKVSIGSGTNVQDMVVIKSLEGMPCSVGSGVTIGHSAVLTGCTVGDGSLVGMGAVIGTGAVVESGALVAAGAVVAPGAVCGGGKLWGGNPATALRDLTAAEKSQLGVQATAYADLAKTHAGALAAL